MLTFIVKSRQRRISFVALIQMWCLFFVFILISFSSHSPSHNITHTHIYIVMRNPAHANHFGSVCHERLTSIRRESEQQLRTQKQQAWRGGKHRSCFHHSSYDCDDTHHRSSGDMLQIHNLNQNHCCLSLRCRLRRTMNRRVRHHHWMMCHYLLLLLLLLC